jgi:anti-sigma regulatory factor (Ser/Thr protein kinase)
MPARSASVPTSRRNVVDVLREAGWDEERIGYVALMTTELVTNAVEHAGTPYTLMVEVTVDGLRVEVHDGSEALPVMGEMCSPLAVRGRGLALVAELSHRWGCEAVVGGKSVWFEALPI